ncbi:MAG: 4Fe-4S cluster-binding domain-containing protein [Spirochaetes bacterium]|nr:4Fe-4S cluster-binding domain-containing protein [Spirochaetota bacterium]
MNFEICERFLSVSGEAPFAGDPVYIVRFSGCNLNCSYCDTPYREESNEILSFDELRNIIFFQIKTYPSIKILLTGGEPLFKNRSQGINELIKTFPQTVFIIETNGSVAIEFSADNAVFVCDIKTPSSLFEKSFEEKNTAFLRKKDCIKYVAAKEDLPWILDSITKIRKLNSDVRIFLSPQWGKISPEEIVEFILANKLDASISIQIHKIIWQADKRGV